MPSRIYLSTDDTPQSDVTVEIISSPSTNMVDLNTRTLTSSLNDTYQQEQQRQQEEQEQQRQHEQQEQQRQQQEQQLNQRGFQHLNVQDALSYIDQVKYTFIDQPQVYYDFLDVMKDFKCQKINASDALTRVNYLFENHPQLIGGFNIFLPPGHGIESQIREQNYSHQVSVNTTSEQSTHTFSSHSTVDVGSSSNQQISQTPSVIQMMPAGGHIHYAMSNQSSINQNNMNNMNIYSSPAGPSSSFNNSHVPSSHGHALSQEPYNASSNIRTTRTQQEFNDAMNYINKIKDRFQQQPYKYQRFLEILRAYERYQRGDSVGSRLTKDDVCAEVTQLFENQEDLLAEFGQFLPDSTHTSNSLSNRMSEFNQDSLYLLQDFGMDLRGNEQGFVINL
ncbi:paired amphipathic helix protein Sin3a-like [Aphidius gifuensis]|uniref:paired amphipathic helix protein Sin3a-like n=1 Tax=Aphidius gifuensis TaxID=684658 RepID=UPI001CDBD035|nr:paired amphipathic helix protein Sin3a-like [Aphidius gifuensis]